MYRDHRRGRAALPVGLGLIAALLATAIPTIAFACLPYSLDGNFSFKDRLELGIVGRVVSVLDDGEQPHARVIVRVDTVLAGAPGPTIEVAMDPGGGCDHPTGELGDQVVVAAGAPGDAGIAWTGGYLSAYNSATWIIGSNGIVASGPMLDGQKQATLAGLVSTLRSMPNAAMSQPVEPSWLTATGVTMIGISLAVVARRRWIRLRKP